MADFRKTRGFAGQSGEGRLTIREERQFTDPHVRFVRINGRVVPIINKNKVGRTMQKAGNPVITAGAVITAIGGTTTAAGHFAKKRKLTAGRAKIFNDAVTKKANSTMFKNNRFVGLVAGSKAGQFFKRSTVAKLAVGTTKVAGKGLIGLAKRPFGKRGLVTGTTLLLTGAGLKAGGFELQTRSPFGADVL